jgi:hypothetical protein
MAGLITPMPTPTLQMPPRAPTISDAAVQQSANDAAAAAAQRQGRASTILTDPQLQQKARATRQSYLSGA